MSANQHEISRKRMRELIEQLPEQEFEDMLAE